jgi:flagellar motor switch protein FliG
VTEVANTEVQELTGPEKAAAILLTLGKPTASQLMKHLTHSELRAVTLAAARLGAVPSDRIEELVQEFSSAYAAGAALLGDASQARALLTDAVPGDQISDILAELGGASLGPDVWKSMANLPDALLAAFLKEEHPLTATFVLAKLEPSLSARVISLLPRELRNQVLVRLLSPPKVGPGALALIEDAVREALLGGAAAARGEDNRAKIADIINNLDASDAEDVMQALAGARPQDARIVRTMLFSFSDLTRLAQRARALLFDKLTTEVIVLALRGTDNDFREPVLSAMASRSRRLVESELANASSAPAAEIEKARRQIVKLVLVMAQRGEIELPQQEETAA